MLLHECWYSVYSNLFDTKNTITCPVLLYVLCNQTRFDKEILQLPQADWLVYLEKINIIVTILRTNECVYITHN